MMDGSGVFMREVVGVGSCYVILVGVGVGVGVGGMGVQGGKCHFIFHEPMEQWKNGILDAASGLVWFGLG